MFGQWAVNKLALPMVRPLPNRVFSLLTIKIMHPLEASGKFIGMSRGDLRGLSAER